MKRLIAYKSSAIITANVDFTTLKNLYNKSISLINKYNDVDINVVKNAINDLQDLFKKEHMLVNGRINVGSHSVSYDWQANGNGNTYTGYSVIDTSYFKSDITRFIEDLCMAFYRTVMNGTDYNTPTLITKITVKGRKTIMRRLIAHNNLIDYTQQGYSHSVNATLNKAQQVLREDEFNKLLSIINTSLDQYQVSMLARNIDLPTEQLQFLVDKNLDAEEMYHMITYCFKDGCDLEQANSICKQWFNK